MTTRADATPDEMIAAMDWAGNFLTGMMREIRLGLRANSD